MTQPPPNWDQKQQAMGASFLQSGLWGAFSESIGHEPHYLMDDGWSCLLIQRRTKLGKYLFAPYGPTLKDSSSLSGALSELKKYAKQSGQDWLRLEPLALSGETAGLEKTLEQSAALPASHSTNPQMTRVIDLKPPAEEILASISQSTRSLIRKNQRENFLRFKTSTNPGDMEIFVRMLDTVADRNQVRFFSQDYFEKQARLLMPKGLLHLEIAQGADKPLAAALIHDYGGMSTYTYAASLPEARQTSASALLLWQAILDAKQRGAQRMDLFGIAADDAPASHPWQGFSSFKKKFGGEIVNHAGTWDLPISGRYRLYRQARRANHLLRRSR